MKWLLFAFWKLFLWSPVLFSHFSHRQCWYNNISKNNIILPRRSDPILKYVKQLFWRPDNNNTSYSCSSYFAENWISRKMFFFFLSIFDDARRALHLHRTFYVCVHGGIRVECTVCIPPFSKHVLIANWKANFWFAFYSYSLGEQLHCHWSKVNSGGGGESSI